MDAMSEPVAKRPRTEHAKAAPATLAHLFEDATAQQLWELREDNDGLLLSLRELEPPPADSGSAAAAGGTSEWATATLAAAPVLPTLAGGQILHTLRMSDRSLTTELLPPRMWGLSALVALDVSRNRLSSLPPEVGGLAALQRLDISRNRLKELPKELGQLKELVTLAAQSNHLRPAKRSLPLAELGSLARLRSIDLRFNQKLKAAAPLLAEFVPQAKAILAGPPSGGGAAATAEPNGKQQEQQQQPNKKKKEVAADRDATLLRSQLEPLSTPMLRRYETHAFGEEPF